VVQGETIALNGVQGADIGVMNTDVRSLTNSMADKKVQLGKELTQGLGAGGDPEVGEQCAEGSEEEIRAMVEGRDLVFICVGLGGGTGSGAAPLVAKIAREEGAFVIVFAIMPFSFEGKRRRTQAEGALSSLGAEASALMTFENSRMGELILPKDGVQAAFAAADDSIGRSIQAVISIVLRPGLIGIGMDDIITVLHNNDSRCLFGYGESKGKNRAQEALANAFKSPLLDKGRMLSQAENVLVHIVGGDSMTLFEIELLMADINKQITDDAQILFGTAFDPSLGDKVAVTIVSSVAHTLPEIVVETPESEIEETTPAVEETPVALAAAVATAESILKLADEAPERKRKNISEKKLSIADPLDGPDLFAEADDLVTGGEEVSEIAGSVEEPEPVAELQTFDGVEEESVEVAPVAGEEVFEEEEAGYDDAEAEYEELDSLGVPSDEEEVVAEEEVANEPVDDPVVEEEVPGYVAVEEPAYVAAEEELVYEAEEEHVANDDQSSAQLEATASKGSQAMFDLEPASRGRFDRSTPTIVDGEDLDVPTFLRKKQRV